MPLPAPAVLDQADDLIAAAQAAGLAERVRAVPLPPGSLSGWSSLCASEYVEAARRMHALVRAAADALDDAGRI